MTIFPGRQMVPGQADYYYPNDQSTRLVWYHDHAHGITRINAYAGLASGYLILDPAQETAWRRRFHRIASTIPLVVQDKVFVDPSYHRSYGPDLGAGPTVTLGSLWYEHVYDPAAFRLLKGGRLSYPA